MLKKTQVFLKVAISLIIFNLSGLSAQNYCPPAFISGLPLDQSIALSWAEPDSLAEYEFTSEGQAITGGIMPTYGVTLTIKTGAVTVAKFVRHTTDNFDWL